MDRGYRGGRRTFSRQWRAYGCRPPVARWSARLSLVAGAAVGVVLLLAVAVLALKVLWLAVMWALFKA